jgi:transcription antitermination factor NusG
MARKFGFEGEHDQPAPQLYEAPHWFACYTRARHEKRVTEQLGERGFETYLPVVSKERQWSDRRKLVEFPLFPGYVFTRFTLAELHQVLTVPGVATVIRNNGVPSPVEEGDLENVRRFVRALQETGEIPDLQPLVPGQPVRVMRGPFAGVEGVVVERRGRRRVLVGLTTIGQGMEIDVDGRSLEPLRLAS